jgi:LacI family transcriptional regulator
MNITIKDIAAKCGISKGTVDRAINNRPGVNEETKAFILRTAAEMGYRPHYLASSLVTGKTKSIGVVVFDLHNTFFAQLLDAISNKAKEFNYFVYITLTEKNPTQEVECIEHLVNGRVDGLILCPINIGDSFESYLKETRIPVVTVMNKLEDASFSHSDINTRQAMHDATRYVISKGYERIVYFSPPLAYEGITNISSQKQRLLGHLDALGSTPASIESVIVPKKSYEEVLDAVKEEAWKENGHHVLKRCVCIEHHATAQTQGS